MMRNCYAVIMAGGGGTRLWPLSRKAKPKQLLSLTGDRTLFQMAIDRMHGLLPPEQILIVTIDEQANLLQQQVPELLKSNFLIEPMPRGTASVVGLAAVELWQRDPNAIMIVLTADHFIMNVEAFQEALLSAVDIAQTGHLVTLGIHPTFPSTGYGYIHRGQELGTFGKHKGYQVLEFKEKPTEELAKELLRQGSHEWNSGMFIWRADRILDEFEVQMPDLFQQLQLIAKAKARGDYHSVILEVWPKIQPQTIDYGIMERAKQVAVIPVSDLGWNDVGSWDTIFDVLCPDKNGNIFIGGKHLELDSISTLVVSDDPEHLIVTVGVENLVIVHTENSLLICRRDETQRVKEVVQKIKETQYNEYL